MLLLEQLYCSPQRMIASQLGTPLGQQPHPTCQSHAQFLPNFTYQNSCRFFGFSCLFMGRRPKEKARMSFTSTKMLTAGLSCDCGSRNHSSVLFSTTLFLYSFSTFDIHLTSSYVRDEAGSGIGLHCVGLLLL